MTDIRRDFVRPLLAASAALLLASSPALADRVLTDPDSGRRLLLRDDGTYNILPADPGAAPQRAGAPNPTDAPNATGAPNTTAAPARPAASSAPSYSDVAFEDVAHAGRGEFVAIQGWIGTLGTGDRFLMFRDRTVSPPYVVVRMSQDTADDTRAGGREPAEGVSTLRATRNWAADLNARCREACAARVEGEVVPAPPGGAPEIIAHHVDVSP